MLGEGGFFAALRQPILSAFADDLRQVVLWPVVYLRGATDVSGFTCFATLGKSLSLSGEPSANPTCCHEGLEDAPDSIFRLITRIFGDWEGR